MQILYNAKTDLLYFRLDDQEQQVINKRLSKDIVLDLGENNRIVGIEILDASKHLRIPYIFGPLWPYSFRNLKRKIME